MHEHGRGALGPSAGPGALHGPPAPGPQQQQQQGAMYAYSAPKVLYDAFKARQARALGITQLCAGLLCIVFNAGAIGAHSIVASIGYGIWGGLVVRYITLISMLVGYLLTVIFSNFKKYLFCF